MGAEDEVDLDAFNRFEEEGWSSRAGSYHEFFAPITSRVVPELLDAARAGAGRDLLDVATGPGYVVAAALERGARATGLDVAPAMVSLAQRLVPGGTFVVGDAESLPFAANSFDAATASFAILHLGRPERAAGELARVLRPGGRAALTAWNDPGRSRLMGLFVDSVAEAGASPPTGVPSGPDFFRFASEDELKRLLEGVGLVEVEVRTLSFSHRFASADALWEGMVAGTVRMRALIEGQDGGTTARIREAFRGLAEPYRTGSEIEVPVEVRLAAAGKPG